VQGCDRCSESFRSFSGVTVQLTAAHKLEAGKSKGHCQSVGEIWYTWPRPGCSNVNVYGARTLCPYASRSRQLSSAAAGVADRVALLLFSRCALEGLGHAIVSLNTALEFR
jgi:hypothetical protein